MAAAPAIAYSTAAFRRERESDWQDFEELLARLERGSISRFSDDDLVALPRLYRATLSSLSIARATILDAALIDYLESLAMRGYFLVYGVRESRRARIADFFRNSWPAAVRGLWKETLFMALLFVLGAVVAFVLVSRDTNWFQALIPLELAQGRTPGASVEMLRESLYGVPEEGGLHIFATSLFTHNSQVAITAYALGFAFGLPTMMLNTYQGLPLGALFTVFNDAGLGWDFAAWLAIHGTTELFAIFIAGACGLRIGTAFAFPGAHGRLAAAAASGKASGAAMLGVILMLLAAGLLEGFGRQLINDMGLRFGIGALMFLLWCSYFYVPRRRWRKGAA